MFWPVCVIVSTWGLTQKIYRQSSAVVKGAYNHHTTHIHTHTQHHEYRVKNMCIWWRRLHCASQAHHRTMRTIRGLFWARRIWVCGMIVVGGTKKRRIFEFCCATLIYAVSYGLCFVCVFRWGERCREYLWQDAWLNIAFHVEWWSPEGRWSMCARPGLGNIV